MNPAPTGDIELAIPNDFHDNPIGDNNGAPPGTTKKDEPDTTLVDVRGKDYIEFGVPLYEASLTHNWHAANKIFVSHPEYVRYAIDMDHNTPLHIAASAQETKGTEKFVEKLLNLMKPEDLKLINKHSNNALHVAAAFGNIEMLKSMVRMNAGLVNLEGEHGALYASAKQGRYETLTYLYGLYPNLDSSVYWNDDSKKYWLLRQCLIYGFFDIALDIVNKYDELAKNMSVHILVLEALARKPDAFERDCTRTSDANDDDAWRLLKLIWRDHILKMPLADIERILMGTAHQINPQSPLPPTGGIGPKTHHHPLTQAPADQEAPAEEGPQAATELKYPSRILFVATKMGNTFFVVELLRTYPNLIWTKNDDDQTIFHVAAEHRRVGIFNILYEMGNWKNTVTVVKDRDGNTMLHLIGKTSKKMRDKTYGASLLLQRELQWFQEVENMMLPSFRESKNKEVKTAHELFFEENKDIVSQDVNWMRDCMIVATLIVTVAFAVAFTVPGGYYQETKDHDPNAGIPIFVHKPTFLVFVIADAVSLSFASTSLMIFLSLLISRHSQRDFLHSLPNKLTMGLITLFISIAAMMVTFSASFFLLYHKGLKWVPITIAVLACIPVFIFSKLQAGVVWDMIGSGPFNPKKHQLYKRWGRYEAVPGEGGPGVRPRPKRNRDPKFFSIVETMYQAQRKPSNEKRAEVNNQRGPHRCDHQVSCNIGCVITVLPPMTNLIASEATIFSPCFVRLNLLALALAFDVFTNLGCTLDGLNWSLSLVSAPWPCFFFTPPSLTISTSLVLFLAPIFNSAVLSMECNSAIVFSMLFML
ncbi:hypothetical protein OSB04_017597 [Centaurea solstitialis]|uniref:PGG domain-containing protein n=1 Tax=Centaurea solstitialis TaxID=347529 RepID=A0AA38W9M1_9ASTR|nr:hypothetical protein OSB04_017597 [Centaurea solstitialis]